ncbi:MAG: EamA family transporter [Rhodospirillales bacterium]|nr:EamA family transporter [Rhodospirillales bacterium]
MPAPMLLRKAAALSFPIPPAMRPTLRAIALPRLSPLARQRAMFGFLCVVWGTTWLAMKVGIAAVPPGLFAGSRWTVAGLALLAWRRAQGHHIGIPRRLIPRLLVASVLLIATNQVIQLYGLRYVPAGLATVISSALTPISLLGFGVLAGQERFTGRQAAALALGIGGILTLFGPKALAGTLGWREVAGAGGVIIGTLCYSAGSILARPMMRTIPPAEVSALTNIVGGAMLLVGSLLFEPGSLAAATGHWGWPAFGAWLYLLLPGSLGATLIYWLLVRDWGAARTGTYAFVSPVVGVVAAMLLFGEHVGLADVAGMTLMLGAAGLVLRR